MPRANVSCVFSVLLCVQMEKLGFVQTDFLDISRWTFLKEPDDQVQVTLKSHEYNRYFASTRTCVHDYISPFKEEVHETHLTIPTLRDATQNRPVSHVIRPKYRHAYTI